MKSPFPGWERKLVKCRKCGTRYFIDYQPYSLSNPIYSLPCNHDIGISFREAVMDVTEPEIISGRILEPKEIQRDRIIIHGKERDWLKL